MACKQAGARPARDWGDIGNLISNFMLVVETSTDMILYVFLDAAFRKHFMRLACCLRRRTTEEEEQTNQRPSVSTVDTAPQAISPPAEWSMEVDGIELASFT